MPLTQSSSKKALSENISKEMDAGKSMKQAVAIAYSVKRKMEHKPEHMKMALDDMKRKMKEKH